MKTHGETAALVTSLMRLADDVLNMDDGPREFAVSFVVAQMVEGRPVNVHIASNAKPELVEYLLQKGIEAAKRADGETKGSA